MLKTKRMSIVPTMKCTLRCKLCSNHIPEFKATIDVTAEEMKNDIDALFVLFERIEWLQFVGGEIFINKHLADVWEYCKRYRSRFDMLIIETNATIMPTDVEFDVLASYGNGAKVMISDYGELSAVRDNILEVLYSKKIPYVTKKYYGSVQHFDGWIDNTGLCDLGETDEEVRIKAKKCAQVRLENMHCYRGKLHRCSNSLFLSELGLFEPNRSDWLRIHDENLSLEEKRKVIEGFYKKSLKSCRFCSWKDGDILPRYPAAEQL